MISADKSCGVPSEAVLDLLTALRRAASRWPDRPALLFDETGESLSFSELAVRVDRVAAALARAGIRRGDRVGIMLPNRVEWPLAWLGLARVGAVMVPVNTGYRTADAGFVLGHAGIRAVVTIAELVPLLVDVRADIEGGFQILCVDGVAQGEALDFSALIQARAGDTPPDPGVDTHTLVNVQYTSGTTGEPKGCMLSHSWFMNRAATAAVFRNGWLHTGDIVRRDERGRFHYVSRMKDMIRRSGENIAAAEVEEVIMRHPGVRLAAVLAVEDDLRGEEVMAYVVPGDGVAREEVSPAVLCAFCAERLARFKVPRYWKYRDDLPRTPSERIRKEALREERQDPTTGAWDRVEGRWR